jgi:ATP-binding cassette subfamily C protein
MQDRGSSPPRVIRTLIPRGQGWKWLAMAALGLVLAAAEAIAAVLIAVLVGAMIPSTDSTIELPLLGDVSRIVPGSTPAAQLRFLAIGMAIFFVAKAGLKLTETYVRSRVTQNTGARLANRLFAGYLAMPYKFHIAHNSSELMRNASWAANEVVTNYLTPIAIMLTDVAMLVFLLGVLVTAAPTATLVTIGFLLPITLIVLRIVRPSLNRLGKVTKKSVQDTLGSLQESLHGIRDVKVLGRERFFEAQFRSTRRRLARSSYMYPTVAEVPSLTIETVLVIAVLGFVAFRSGQGEVPTESLPFLGLFAYAGLRMMPAMSSIVAAINRIRYGQSVAETIATNIQMVDAEAEEVPEDDAAPVTFEAAIELEGVGFSYEDGTEVIRNLDLIIRRGESVGIVGVTGAGKSTLLDLILGLLRPTAGKITVDGRDLQSDIRGWQAAIGLVPQSVYLLDDTIRRNVAFGIRDDEIDEDALAGAIQLARLEGFIGTLPQGLESMVGERGVRLSGGQRQRVAIARALYRRPQILIFDEGTASLDNLTEAELLRAIEGLRGERTIITVAHRLTTVQGCDRVILLADGEIVDQGGYEELRDRNRTFREMTG